MQGGAERSAVPCMPMCATPAVQHALSIAVQFGKAGQGQQPSFNQLGR
jgi:hypothetical protein